MPEQPLAPTLKRVDAVERLHKMHGVATCCNAMHGRERDAPVTGFLRWRVWAELQNTRAAFRLGSLLTANPQAFESLLLWSGHPGQYSGASCSVIVMRPTSLDWLRGETMGYHGCRGASHQAPTPPVVCQSCSSQVRCSSGRPLGNCTLVA